MKLPAGIGAVSFGSKSCPLAPHQMPDTTTQSRSVYRRHSPEVGSGQCDGAISSKQSLDQRVALLHLWIVRAVGHERRHAPHGPTCRCKRPPNTSLPINLKTAKTLCLNVSAPLLAHVDQVIE